MGFQKRFMEEKAVKLLDGIVNHIGIDKKTGLIKDGSSEEILDCYENGSFAIASFLIGSIETARTVLDGIINHIGFDPKTELLFNKIGISREEHKKITPGEKKIYLANQVLYSILCELNNRHEESKKLRNKIDKEIGVFELKLKNKEYIFYKHGKNQKYFYPFNEILISIYDYITGQKEKAEKRFSNVMELCFNGELNLVRNRFEGNFYPTLDSALASTYYSISGKKKKWQKDY